MSSTKSLLQGLSDKVKCAREYALLGNYGTSLKYFEVAIENVDSYIKKIDESSVSEWVKVRKALQEEYKIIYNLENQIQKFSDHLSRPPRPQSANMNFVVEKRQTPSPVYSMDDDPFSRASPEEKDPMVWDPPPPRQPISRVRKLPVVRRDPSDGGNSDDLFKVHGKNSKPVSSDRRIAAKQIGNQYSRLNSNAKQPLNRPGRKSDVSSDNKAGEKKTNSSTEHDETPVPKKFVAGNPSDQELVDLISRDVLQINTGVKWSDIAGLEEAKNLLHEAIVLPLWMPWYFQGIRSPWAGVLMFGPPGTGKTMLAKAVANETGTTFFNVSVATITSKWRGESEKLIKILFQMARFYAPSTIFIDEIDSLCGQRGDSGEHEASRRVKTELLVQMDGIHVDNQQEGNKEKGTEKEKVEGEEGETKEEEEDEEGERPKTVLVLGATNHPWYLDEALRRRLEKRIYIPLPDFESRKSLFQLCLKSITLSEDVDMDKLATMTEGYSNADIKLVCRDAALMGVRQLIKEKGPGLDKGALQMKRTEVMETPVTMEDFEGAVKKCSTSVGKELLSKYGEWMEEFGSK